ncbi:MAG: polysaccharide deacetylase family protein [Candidatus Magasanikbacteria bacterium]|nr:polysaccharide deacetylase family protein [Candidatus Magasanikbacteria bacterium]
MKKYYKKLVFSFIGFVVCSGLIAVGFFYWKNLQEQQYENYEATVEYDQMKVAEEQADILAKATSSTLNVNDPKNLSSKIYHVRFGILMYHHIDNKNKRLSVRQENLDAQIKYLLDNGYKFIKLSEAFKTFASSTTSTYPYDKTVVLTFDDGYRDFYLSAYPILKKYNVPAGLYVINQDIGKRGNVTWDMIKQIHSDGLVEIGVHTVNHLPLGKLKPETVYYQMAKSRELLEAALNDKIDTIIYPFGSFNENVKKQAKQIGFIGGASVYFGQRPSGQDLYSWRRVMINNTDIGPLLLRKLYIAFELVK